MVYATHNYTEFILFQKSVMAPDSDRRFPSHVGIRGMELYIPKLYVEQSELEKVFFQCLHILLFSIVLNEFKIASRGQLQNCVIWLRKIGVPVVRCFSKLLYV